MSNSQAAPGPNHLWSRSTALFLVLVGLLLSIVSFLVVMFMPDLTRAMGLDGSAPEAAETVGPYGLLLAVTEPSAGSLKLIQAALTALPLIWLPLAVARIFRRARAGYALVLLPPVMWLLNNGTILIGTEYGLADQANPIRVSALLGIPASFVFLSLTLVLWASTYRLRVGALSLISVGAVLLAAIAGLLQDGSGWGIALSVGVLWWLNRTGPIRWMSALGSAVAALALVIVVQFGAGAMAHDSSAQQSDDAGLSATTRTDWEEQFLLGLSYPEPITGGSSVFDVTTEGGASAPETDASAASGYLDVVATDPGAAVKLYLDKLLFVIKSFGAAIAFVIVGFTLVLVRRGAQGRALGAALAIAAPTLLFGLALPVATMPLLVNYGVLAAALGMLVAVALGGLVWSVTSMPAHVRASERQRLSDRRAFGEDGPTGIGISAIVPTRNGSAVIEQTVRALAERLGERDEIIVVENGSTDDTAERLALLAGEWSYRPHFVSMHSKPGLGEALRAGVLASKGTRLLLTADDLPFGFSDLDEFERLPADVIVAIGSKAHPASNVDRHPRRTLQSKIFRFLRGALLQSRVGDSQGTIWVDGRWGRALALHSRETGLMWTTELVLAAEQQGVTVTEVPVELHEQHESGASRFRFADAWSSVVGFTRLAIYKDDYCGEEWTNSGDGAADGMPARVR